MSLEDQLKQDEILFGMSVVRRTPEGVEYRICPTEIYDQTEKIKNQQESLRAYRARAEAAERKVQRVRTVVIAALDLKMAHTYLDSMRKIYEVVK